MALFEDSRIGNTSSLWEYRDLEESYDFERTDVIYWRDFMLDHWTWAFYASAIYYVTVFGLEKYMKDRPPVKLKTSFILWNAMLGIFSILGFLRIYSYMSQYFREENGLYNSICIRDNTDVRMVFWGVAFAISKFFELFDTLFLVLHKKKIQTLQWFHHMTALIIAWITMPYAEPMARWCVLMNYGVHSFMYPYFALKMAGVHIPNIIANAITTAQFAQMIIASCMNIATIAFMGLGYPCYRTPVSIALFVLIYGSFVFLFGQLFVRLVLNPKRTKHVKSS